MSLPKEAQELLDTFTKATPRTVVHSVNDYTGKSVTFKVSDGVTGKCWSFTCVDEYYLNPSLEYNLDKIREDILRERGELFSKSLASGSTTTTASGIYTYAPTHSAPASGTIPSVISVNEYNSRSVKSKPAVKKVKAEKKKDYSKVRQYGIF